MFSFYFPLSWLQPDLKYLFPLARSLAAFVVERKTTGGCGGGGFSFSCFMHEAILIYDHEFGRLDESEEKERREICCASFWLPPDMFVCAESERVGGGRGCGAEFVVPPKSSFLVELQASTKASCPINIKQSERSIPRRSPRRNFRPLSAACKNPN